MIWELIKRDPAWRVIPVFAAMSTVVWMLLPPNGSIFILGPVGFTMLFTYPRSRQRYTLLQVSLPIAGKQLFLSRIALLLALIWLPVIAAVTLTAALRSNRTWVDHLPLLEAAAVITAALLVIQCFRVQIIEVPAWLPVIVGGGILFPLVLLGDLAPRSVATAIAVLGGCGLVSAALILQAFASVPRSFQVAPAEPAAARSNKRRRAWPTATWWPVFYSLYGGWQAVLWLMGPFFGMLGGEGGFAAIGILGFFITCRARMHWLLHLPIPPRRLFWAVWLPITAAMIAGFVLNILFGRAMPRPAGVLPKTRMIAFAVVLISWLIQICALQLQGWRKLRNISPAVRIILSAAPSYAIFLTPTFLQMAGEPLGRNLVLDLLTTNLASVLPDNLWMIALMAALSVGGLYWLAEKLFRDGIRAD